MCDRAVGERFRRHRARELGQVGLADEHEPRGAEALGEPRVGLLVPVEVLQHLHAAMERVPGRVADAVLHEERHASERSGRELGVGRGGERLVVETMDDRVELRVELLDAAIAPSTSSVGVTSPARTASACAVASIHAKSSVMALLLWRGLVRRGTWYG